MLMDGNWKAMNQEHMILVHSAFIDSKSQADQSETLHYFSLRPRRPDR
jgi:hypothetical protein